MSPLRAVTEAKEITRFRLKNWRHRMKKRVNKTEVSFKITQWFALQLAAPDRELTMMLHPGLVSDESIS